MNRRARAPRARKSLGQHFLHDADVLHDIVRALPEPGRSLVEIGPGTGELTSALLEAGHDVFALEIEPRMIRLLSQRFGAHPRLHLFEGDARDVDLATLTGGAPHDVAGNLPYFAANPIIRRFLESVQPPGEAVVMVQKEVGKEIAAPPGKMSLLAISVAVYARSEYLFDVHPSSFRPPPNVMSAVVRLEVLEQPLVPRDDIEEFFDLVSRTFRNPRKQIHNSLGQGTWLPPGGASEALEAAAIEPMRRPETLGVSEWLALLAACRDIRSRA